MPFGLTNAPATFQSYINNALTGLLDDICVAYMDDILIFSKDPAQHSDNTRKILARLREYGLYLNPAKCAFNVTEVAFLRYRISADRISIDSRRVQAIRDWPAPTSYRDIQVFLGFTNFYRIFIVSYSIIVAAIIALLVGMQKGKKTGPFIWTKDAQQAFETIKERFCSAPLLVHFDPQRRCRVETDASIIAIGAILTQLHVVEGRLVWKPVAFFSKKLIPAETRYTTGDQELLAIVKAFQEWRHYLEGASERTLVLTDHDALKAFATAKNLSRRQARWAEALAAFDFEIVYRKGKENPADGLSRRPDYLQVDQEEESDPMVKLLQDRIMGAIPAEHVRVRRESPAELEQAHVPGGAGIGVVTRKQRKDASAPVTIQAQAGPKHSVI